ncbi:MAG: 50S ribosomal protein L10 [Candidatus Spechtbacterales bacterium]|nr:50S ribosomal protein L10 [Candidatus Spechtbacterales bacterium]
MAITRQKKEEIVKEIGGEFDSAKVVLFTDFKGMDVNSITALRRKVREVGGRFVVVKKTLLKRILEEKKVEGLDPLEMEGQIAVAFGSDDAVATAKAVNEMKKEVEAPQIIAGIMEGSLLSAEQVIELASLPGREELLGKVVGTINAPLSGFVNVLHGNLRGLVYALNAIKDQKA